MDKAEGTVFGSCDKGGKDGVVGFGVDDPARPCLLHKLLQGQVFSPRSIRQKPRQFAHGDMGCRLVR